MTASRAAAEEKHVILVLDDDSAVRNSLKFVLEIEGFDVRVYATPAALLDENSLPARSCLVVDYRMPDMNGLELVARLRDRRVSIPAILITVRPSAELRSHAAAAGVPIVEKPFEGAGLLERIREAFAAPSQ
jgi:two-component system, LuxR family, response regulator FixJ